MLQLTKIEDTVAASLVRYFFTDNFASHAGEWVDIRREAKPLSTE